MKPLIVFCLLSDAPCQFALFLFLSFLYLYTLSNYEPFLQIIIITFAFHSIHKTKQNICLRACCVAVCVCLFVACRVGPSPGPIPK